MKIHYFLIGLLILSHNPILGQTAEDGNDEKAAKKTKKQNIQTYTPSVLLRKGQWELKVFHNIYTQTASFNADGKVSKSANRTTYYTSINQFLIGISPSINVGFDFWAKAVRIDESSSSALKVFRFGGSDRERFAPIYVGPKIKIAPFKKLSRLSIETSFLLPLAEDMEGRISTNEFSDVFLETDRSLIMNNIYFDRNLNDKLQLFLKFAQWISLPRESFAENAFVETPFSVFLTYFPNRRISFYLIEEYWPKHIGEAFSSFFIQSGVGMKYQLIPGRLEIEGLYTKFLIGSDQEGAGSTYNIGLRYLR